MSLKHLWTVLFIAFCVFVVVITYSSKTIYTQNLKKVTLDFTTTERFDHLYDIEGEVTENIGNYYAVEFVLPVATQSMKYVDPDIGDSIDVSFPNDLTISQTGKIFKKDYTSNGIIFMVGFDNHALSDATLEGGVVGRFEWQSDYYDSVVPKDSLVRIGEQYYLLKVEAQTGFLGKEYVAVYQSIIILDEFNGMAAIFREQDRDVPYIIHFDKPVANGDKVKFYP